MTAGSFGFWLLCLHASNFRPVISNSSSSNRRRSVVMSSSLLCFDRATAFSVDCEALTHTGVCELCLRRANIARRFRNSILFPFDRYPQFTIQCFSKSPLLGGKTRKGEYHSEASESYLASAVRSDHGLVGWKGTHSSLSHSASTPPFSSSLPSPVEEWSSRYQLCSQIGRAHV